MTAIVKIRDEHLKYRAAQESWEKAVAEMEVCKISHSPPSVCRLDVTIVQLVLWMMRMPVATAIKSKNSYHSIPRVPPPECQCFPCWGRNGINITGVIAESYLKKIADALSWIALAAFCYCTQYMWNITMNNPLDNVPVKSSKRPMFGWYLA